jgi:hypothetical protein
MPPTYIPQMFNLEVNDLRVIRQVADQKGLGDKGFSAALRSIIREWALQNYTGKLTDDKNMTSRQ